ncbi:glutaredoxin domain-containing protein [Salinicola salarius]|uniref:glutaredoxin domain-containing protein n=1 Tax=Salinicola salarius TaxID=430457 RepID=UPI0023E354AD|nr:glutaredoxin domain-containing protein [Salinicola salarius]MDF3917475.1 glutaredoxin domain-containing protein [Salinicola salarius]
MNTTVYTKHRCPKCDMTKRAMKGREFYTVNVEEDPDAYRFITEELGIRMMPVVVVRDDANQIIDHWHDLRPDKISRWKDAA